MNKNKGMLLFAGGFVALMVLTIVVSTMIIGVRMIGEQATVNKKEVYEDEAYGFINENIVESGNANKIVILSIEGDILSKTNDYYGTGIYNHEEFLEQLDYLQEDSDVKGVLLEIDSPGGGVYESAQVYDRLKEISKDRSIPIYVSMKSMATSGGYYIAMAGDKLYASEETTTGSIGVIMSNLNYSEMLKNEGIEDTTVKSGPLKDMGSTQRAETEEERQVLQQLVDNAYNRFLKVVAKNRNMSEETLRPLADGRIYDGVQAKENGLIDEIGYLEKALKDLKSGNSLQGATVVRYELSDYTYDYNTSREYDSEDTGEYDYDTDKTPSWLNEKINDFLGNKKSSSTENKEKKKQRTTKIMPKLMYSYGAN